MRDAVTEFAAQLRSPEGWALGRFVVPAARLDELAAESARCSGDRTAPWRVSALVGDTAARDVASLRAFNRAHAGRLVVDTIECRATDRATIERVTRDVARDAGPDMVLFFELPIDRDPAPLLAVVRDARGRAKVRTGGVAPEAFPSTAKLARFIARCASLGVPFKATAGLHHPLRGEQRLTYASDSLCATMFGFMNVFVAAAMAHAGLDEAGIAHALEERDPEAFELGADTLRWREHAVSLDQLVATRRSFALSFGSCSFREPVDDLRQLGLL
jgi:hypothetical protein